MYLFTLFRLFQQKYLSKRYFLGDIELPTINHQITTIVHVMFTDITSPKTHYILKTLISNDMVYHIFIELDISIFVKLMYESCVDMMELEFIFQFY